MKADLPARGVDPLTLKLGDKVRFKRLMLLEYFGTHCIVGMGTVEMIKFGCIYFKSRRGRFRVSIDHPAWTEALLLSPNEAR